MRSIPEVGREGRIGPGKVFVSDLYNKVRFYHRNLSLTAFKAWLVNANANGIIALARADLRESVNPQQIRDSEIDDMGAQFHLVIDPTK